MKFENTENTHLKSDLIYSSLRLKFIHMDEIDIKYSHVHVVVISDDKNIFMARHVPRKWRFKMPVDLLEFN